MIFTILPIIISSIALVVSIYMAMLQSRYASAEYEYKLDPTFELFGTMGVQITKTQDGHSSLPYLENLQVTFINQNGLERLYMIDPNYVVEDVNSDDLSASIKDYFQRAFENGPDLQYGDNIYYYRFVVFQGLDDDIDLEVFYVKTSPIRDAAPVALRFKNLSYVELVEFEKGHLDDENYAGERQIAAQYRDIMEYLIEFS